MYRDRNIKDSQKRLPYPQSLTPVFFFLGAVEDNSNSVSSWMKFTLTELSPYSHTIMRPSLLLDTLYGLQVLLDVFN